MKNQIIFFLGLLFFSCSEPNTHLILEKIQLINNNGDLKTVETVSALKNEKDSTEDLWIDYTFLDIYFY